MKKITLLFLFFSFQNNVFGQEMRVSDLPKGIFFDKYKELLLIVSNDNYGVEYHRGRDTFVSCPLLLSFLNKEQIDKKTGKKIQVKLVDGKYYITIDSYKNEPVYKKSFIKF